MRSSNSLSAGVFDIVVFCLPEHQASELAWLYLRGKDVPERSDDVLGCRDDALHEWNVEIEVLVIDDVDDLSLHDFLERGEVADVSGFRVDVALDRDVERIVVTVPVRVVALTEQPGVLLIGELR